MTRSRFLPLLALAIVACTPTVGTSSGPAPATNEYRTLLARLQAKDTSIDFTALRLAHAASPDYAPYGSDADDHRDSLSAALERRGDRRVIGEADAASAIDYLDIRTHGL